MHNRHSGNTTPPLAMLDALRAGLARPDFSRSSFEKVMFPVSKCRQSSLKTPSRSVVFFESIADTGFGHQITRLRWIGLELLTELTHEHTQVMRVGGLGAPHIAQELAMRNDASGIADEDGQKTKGDWREMNLVASAKDLPFGQIDAKLSDREERFLAAL